MNNPAANNQTTERTPNPFAAPQAVDNQTAGTSMATSQAMAAVQGAVVMAKQFPRNQAEAMQRILDACTRKSLANEAIYQFPKGGTSVTGPSIRLAEVLAQNWGNIDFGIIELTQEGGRSQVMAYGWDLETNVRQQKIFMVDHKMKAHGSIKTLTDPRDIYEHTANQGARRMRACILGILPRDVVEAAMSQVLMTQRNSVEAPEEEIKSLVEAFAKFGVSEAAIKTRLGHNLKSVSAAEVLRFRQIYASIRDEMSSPKDWFDIEAEPLKQRPEQPTLTEDKFQEHLANWKDTVESGGITVEQVLAMVESKYSITKEQKAEILALNPAQEDTNEDS